MVRSDSTGQVRRRRIKTTLALCQAYHKFMSVQPCVIGPARAPSVCPWCATAILLSHIQHRRVPQRSMQILIACTTSRKIKGVLPCHWPWLGVLAEPPRRLGKEPTLQHGLPVGGHSYQQGCQSSPIHPGRLSGGNYRLHDLTALIGDVVRLQRFATTEVRVVYKNWKHQVL
jgi:hypothetical protein